MGMHPCAPGAARPSLPQGWWLGTGGAGGDGTDGGKTGSGMGLGCGAGGSQAGGLQRGGGRSLIAPCNRTHTLWVRWRQGGPQAGGGGGGGGVSLRAPPSLPGQPRAAGEGRMRHFCCCHTQRSGVNGKALQARVPPRHPTRHRHVRGCLRGQAEPGQPPSPCCSRRAPGPPAMPQHGGAGAKARGAARGGQAAVAGGAAPRGGSVVGALRPLHPGSLTRAPGQHLSKQVSVRDGGAAGTCRGPLGGGG